MVNLPVVWFDGQVAKAHAMQARLQDEELLLSEAPDGPPLRRYAQQDLRWPEFGSPVRQLSLPDGASLEGAEPAAWDRWLAEAGGPRPMHWLRHPLLAPLMAVLSLVALAGAGLWGVPALTQLLVPWVPPSWEQRLGDAVLREVDEAWLEPSRLSEFQREQALATLQPLIAQLDQEPQRLNLLFRAAPPRLGPNAFALPGGTVVLTDALVRELPGHPALAGVLAHEWGHVKHRHGLQHVARFASWSALTSLWLGDSSWLMATAPAVLLQARYSRDAEREADAEARRLMTAAGIDPREMLHFFAIARRFQGEAVDRTEGQGLDTHPATDERVRFFETGTR